MKTIKIKFTGKDWEKLAPGKVPYPFERLKENYNLEFSDAPDYIISKESRNFYSDCLRKYANAPIRILFAGEAFCPDFNIFDYAIGFDPLSYSDRYFRLNTQNFFSFDSAINLSKNELDIEEITHKNRKFCNFIYSNSASNSMRATLFKHLYEYRHIDAAGALLRNTDSRIETGANWCQAKIDFQKGYKFTLAIENSQYRGYTTEKILHPMTAYSIPIYWGNEEIGKEFNTKSFINCHDYHSLEGLIEAIKEVDQNDELYRKMLCEPWQTEEQVHCEKRNKHDFDSFIRNIFDQDIACSRRRGDGTWAWCYEEALKKRIDLHENKLHSPRHRFSRRLQKWGIK